jgi:hypothetical protein
MFAAALWIGGQDENLQLRVAALKFGSEGDDFWPGPLTVDQNASVDRSVCEKWDKHYRITKAEVERFISSFEKDATGKIIPNTYDPETLTDAIRNYPAHGDLSKKQSRYLAPFYDNDHDGEYNYAKGDYPYYDFEGKLCPITIRDSLRELGQLIYTPIPTMESDPNYGTGGLVPALGGLLVDQVLKGDETLWWIFNDKGNAHTESGSENPIGLEIRAQAFAFTMNDEINNMTFYSYEIINRSTFTLTNTYFSQWVDPDLGYSFDDFVGCDVKRGLGYCYNGKAIDGPGTGSYSGNPPAVGIDFFQGPYMDPSPNHQDRPKIDTMQLATDITANPSFFEKYRDSTGALNQILLTDDAEALYKINYKCWQPYNGDSVLACAINGVNFGNGIPDDERFGMRRFVYYNNVSGANNGEPAKATDYYNYLRGIWKNNSRMKFGGDGYQNGITSLNCDFMFPGNSDPWNWGTMWKNPITDGGFPNDPRGWTEEQAGNNPDDRRFMQSAGPFTLKPGAINYITVGIPWAQATSGGPYASVELLRTIDDKCQALFDNCFNILEGPDAPELTIQELDRELILYIANEKVSNNYNEAYEKTDIRIPREYVYSQIAIDTIHLSVTNPDNGQTYLVDSIIYKDSIREYDRKYHFEGYQIFQLKDATVGIDEIYDQSKSRLAAQCDLENDAKKLVNYTLNQSIGDIEPKVMVDGLNQGIRHTFRITEDMFATTNDRRIVNNKKYYYVAVAYAYNNFKEFSPTDATKVDGQKEPYLQGRKRGGGGKIEAISGIPHKPDASGNLVQSSYGMMPEIFRLEGNGNGGIVAGLNFQKTTLESLMGKHGEEPTTNFLEILGYEKNFGPVNIKIVDPLKVKSGEFILKVVPNEWTPENEITGNVNLDTCYWVVMRQDGQPITITNGLPVHYIKSDRPIADVNEQIIVDLGISISMTNPKPIATDLGLASALRLKEGVVIDGSLLTSSLTFADSRNQWLTGIVDDDGDSRINWIRSGSSLGGNDVNNDAAPKGMETTEYINQDYFYLTGIGTAPELHAIDPKQQYEKIAGGWWAPYRLTSMTLKHPAFSEYYYIQSGETYTSRPITENPSLVSNDMNNLASVNIVFTNDTSKWTRCPVIEMGDVPELTEGGAMKFQLRRHASVNKKGQDDGTGTGMGWFPGYAINLETGERLNIMFGENSMYGQHNGRDMQWNPSAPSAFDPNVTMGGMHYIYVFGTTPYKLYGYEYPYYKQGFNYNMLVTPPRYDQGQWAYDLLTKLSVVTKIIGISGGVEEQGIAAGHKLFGAVMWVGCPLATCFEFGPQSTVQGRSQSNIPNDATVSIRVRKPYVKNWTPVDVASVPQNDNRPMYQFSITKDIETIIGHQPTLETALDNMSVVPNPYFGASTYELDQVQNLVKIINVPTNAYITIYTVDGTVVRKLRGPSKFENGTLPYVEWDLKNHKGLPISGGTYLIHVKSDAGERIIKWFGALRPVDLNSFQ